MNRWAARFGAALAAGMLLMAPAAAGATEPPAFSGAYVLDETEAGVLGSERAALETEVRDFAAEHGVQLFVVYVDRFTSPEDPLDWGAATAEKNFLGDDGVLLSVAVQDRLFDLNAPQALISDAQYTALTDDYVRPALKRGDWAGVVGETLRGIERTVLDPGTNGTGIAVAVVGGVVVLGGGAAAIVLARKRRRAGAEGASPEELPLSELEARASALLVRVDDDVRSSEQELGFAQAQFGEDAAAPFAAAIAEARAQLHAAFLLRQQLDDAEPDTPEQQRAWLTEIIARCEGAKASLEAHTESFSRLREVEQRAPEALAQLRLALPGVEQRLLAGRGVAAELDGVYAASITAPIAANLAEAEQRLGLVAECLVAADAELAAGQTGAAAVSIRAGEAALEQAGALADSPSTVRAELAESAQQLGAAHDDLRADLQLAAALAAGAGAEDRAALEAAVAEVSAVLAADTAGDPVRALSAAAAANVRIDAAIGTARESAERLRRAEAARDEALIPARAEVLAAEQFIETRRGAIGPEARTRLSEAKRQLQIAEELAQTDPLRSAQSAQQASQYARAASRLASADVSGWGDGPGSPGTGGGSFGGAVLGGILGGLLSGSGGSSGSRSSGGWSGSNGGFTGGWNGGGSIGGSGGGFGGSRGSGGGGRRGGGGRF